MFVPSLKSEATVHGTLVKRLAFRTRVSCCVLGYTADVVVVFSLLSSLSPVVFDRGLASDRRRRAERSSQLTVGGLLWPDGNPSPSCFGESGVTRALWAGQAVYVAFVTLTDSRASIEEAAPLRVFDNPSPDLVPPLSLNVAVHQVAAVG